MNSSEVMSSCTFRVPSEMLPSTTPQLPWQLAMFVLFTAAANCNQAESPSSTALRPPAYRYVEYSCRYVDESCIALHGGELAMHPRCAAGPGQKMACGIQPTSTPPFLVSSPFPLSNLAFSLFFVSPEILALRGVLSWHS